MVKLVIVTKMLVVDYFKVVAVDSYKDLEVILEKVKVVVDLKLLLINKEENLIINKVLKADLLMHLFRKVFEEIIIYYFEVQVKAKQIDIEIL